MKRHVFVGAMLLILGIALAAATPLPAAERLTKEDVARLAAAGVGDDVIVLKIKADGAVFDLSTDDILYLKSAKVSDEVIAAMLMTSVGPAAVPLAVPPAVPSAAAAVTEPAKVEVVVSTGPGPASQPSVSAGSPVEYGLANDPVGIGLGGAEATVMFTNQAGRKLSVLVDQVNRRITYFSGTMPQMLTLAQGDIKSTSLPAGEYTVRWTGKPVRFKVALPAQRLIKFVAAPGGEGLNSPPHITIFEGDVAVASGSLGDTVAGAGSEESMACSTASAVAPVALCPHGAELSTCCPLCSPPQIVNNYNTYYTEPSPTSSTVSYSTVGPTGWNVSGCGYTYQPAPPQQQWHYVQPQVVPVPVYYSPRRVYIQDRHHHRPSHRSHSTYPSYYRHDDHDRHRQHSCGTGLIDGLLTPNTILWGGVGALIGDRKNKAGQGAAIGVAFGMLLDKTH
ncbi:MAG: hypothetical protein RDV41_07100 [Planctomycetota bacterium]|nr:hypothetical protein [Planctomycetota bacterium]